MNWYEAHPDRLVLEWIRVSSKYPDWLLERDAFETLGWRGKIAENVAHIMPHPLEVRIEYPDAFPAVPPEVRVLSPELNPEHVGHRWHRWYGNGDLCYIRPADWNMATTAEEIIDKLHDWYFNYTAAVNGLINKMPDQGRALIDGGI